MLCIIKGSTPPWHGNHEIWFTYFSPLTILICSDTVLRNDFYCTIYTEEPPCTIWCRFNTVSFLYNPHKRHPIACPLGQAMGCLLHDDVIKWKHVPHYWPFSAGNSPVTGEFPPQRPVTRSFDVFFDLRPNKRLSKQSWGCWFETLSRPLWHHCDGVFKLLIYIPHPSL